MHDEVLESKATGRDRDEVLADARQQARDWFGEVPFTVLLGEVNFNRRDASYRILGKAGEYVAEFRAEASNESAG